jgi:hypothetical protein
VIKLSRAIGRVNSGQKYKVAENVFTYIITPLSHRYLLVETEKVSETLDFCSNLTQLITRENFIAR